MFEDWTGRSLRGCVVYNCKHSIADNFCQTNCNPALYPELLGKDGKGWYFNSSIAEQTNDMAFHAIVREMLHAIVQFFSLTK
jgi:hypothetical protein